jgi:hypothetical protein
MASLLVLLSRRSPQGTRSTVSGQAYGSVWPLFKDTDARAFASATPGLNVPWSVVSDADQVPAPEGV